MRDVIFRFVKNLVCRPHPEGGFWVWQLILNFFFLSLVSCNCVVLWTHTVVGLGDHNNTWPPGCSKIVSMPSYFIIDRF